MLRALSSKRDRIVATGGRGLSRGSPLVILVALLFGSSPSAAQPFGGTPWAIPGQVETENYDLGGAGVGYFDTTAANAGGQYRSDGVDIWFASGEGYYTGAMATGEWLEHTVNVAASGPYTLRLRLATPNNGRAVHVELGGVNVTGPIAIPNTGGWQSWQTVSVPVTLAAGEQVMRLAIDTGGLNMSWIELQSVSGTPTVSTPSIAPNGGTYTGSVEVALATATPGASIHYTTNGSTPNLSSTLYTSPFTLTSNATVRAIGVLAGSNDSAVASATFTVTPAGGGGQLPHSGIPWTIPGQVETEDYDLGGSGIAYFDTTTANAGGQYRSDGVDIWFDSGEGYYTGAMATGEWLEYTVNVAASGPYTLRLRLATPNNGRAVHVELGGVNVTGPIAIPNTGGWQSWQTVSVPVTLAAGEQVMRLAIDTGGLNMSFIDLESVSGTPTVSTPAIAPNGGTYTGSVEVALATATPGASIHYTTDGSTPNSSSTLYTAPFTLTSSATVRAIGVLAGSNDSAVASATFTVTPAGGGGNQPPFGGTPWAIPGQVETEDYDLGGAGVAYSDTTAANSGGQYRSDGVDIWFDSGEGYYTGAMASGEWLEYTVNVAEAGPYTLRLRLATPNNGRAVHVELGGVNVTGPIAIPNTGGWQSWQTVSRPVTLAAGEQVMRLAIDTGGLNMSWISLQPPLEAPAIVPSGGTFSGAVTVTLESGPETAAIHYTTDGSTPDASSPIYLTPFTLTESATVKAVAMNGAQHSAVAAANFGIVGLESTTTWTRWEQTLVSVADYPNPYADVALSATFVGPSGQVIDTRGFWDGENIFKLRFMFPEPGTWIWSTTSSDPENPDLHQQTGTVQVGAYQGSNPLYDRGYLRVSSNQRYLTFGDGQPFFWLGDTSWGAPTNATQQEWETYVDNRRAKGFNVLLISIAMDFTNSSDGNPGPGGGGAGAADVDGHRPFFGNDIGDLAMWNPEFWKSYEKKVQYANEQGLVVVIDGVAQPRRIVPLQSESPALQLFARNVAARFMGNFVVYAQQYDRPYSQLGNDVGFALRDVAPFHLITNHPPYFEDRNGDGGNDSVETAEDYYDQPYLDFSGNQPGAGWTTPFLFDGFDNELAARRAIEWNLRLYNRAPHKPLIVSESAYDSSVRHDPDDPFHVLVGDVYLPRMARSAAYWNVLSGSAGYSFGHGQTFYWGPRSIDGQAGSWDWQSAIDMPSSFQMVHMKGFFESLEWWRLVPDHELVLNQPAPWVERMVLARTSSGDLAVAYLPDSTDIVIDMTAFPTAMDVTWFDPQANAYQSTSTTVANSGPASIARPAEWDDAVLLLTATTAPPTESGIHDDFSDNDADGWVVVDESANASNWTVTGGAYRQSNFTGNLGAALHEGYHLGTHSHLPAASGSSSYEFSVVATPLAPSGEEVGVLFNYRDVDNYYRFVTSFSDGFSRLEKRVGGNFSTLARNARGYPPGTPLAIVVAVEDGVIQIAVNGEKLFSAYDTDLADGTVALYSRDAVSFDDVAIIPLANEPKIAIAEPTDYSVIPGTTLSVTATVLNKPSTATVELELDGSPASCTAATENDPGEFTASCTAVGPGVHSLTASLIDLGQVLDTDSHDSVATEGNVYVAIGDSIFWGDGDRYAADGITLNGWRRALHGFHSNLVDDLNAATGVANLVFNEAVRGDSMQLMLNARLDSYLERNPDANFAILGLGTNDAGGTTPRASGLNCAGGSCNGTYKGHLRTVISILNNAGLTPIVVQVPPRFGDTVGTTPYTDPAAHPVNATIISEYNRVIRGEDANPLSGFIVGPDQLDYYLTGGSNRFDLFYDNLHPNALATEILAAQLRNVIAGGSDLPFVVDDLCVILVGGGSCEVPMPYKQDLLEPGDRPYVDRTDVILETIPSVLDGGRWIRTADADRVQSNGDYLSFEVEKTSIVYVAFDADAVPPPWLAPASGFAETGLDVATDNPAAPSLELYSKTFPAGSVSLGGADEGTTGAEANYLVIVQ